VETIQQNVFTGIRFYVALPYVSPEILLI